MNQGFEYRASIGREADGLTVLSYLAGRYRHSHESEWRDRVHRGEVRLEGLATHEGCLVRAGQCLVWSRPPWEEPSVPMGYALLFRDDHLIAVAKPRGLPSLPGGGFLTHTLLHLVRRQWPEATPAHRLGRGTSGLVLFARTAAARRALAAAWRGRTVEKVYRALVRGVPAAAELTIDLPIGLVPHPRLGQVHAAVTCGKDAHTRARVIGSREGNGLLEIVIATGRPHQIRIHMAAVGHPLVGDPLYASGGGILAEAGLPGDPGYWLHAHQLALTHPETSRTLRLECPPAAMLRP